MPQANRYEVRFNPDFNDGGEDRGAYYVDVRGDEFGYLHADMVVRSSTSYGGAWSGYYRNYEEARRAMENYRSINREETIMPFRTAIQRTREEVLRRGVPQIRSTRATSHGEYYISFGTDNYLHNDGTIWSLCCNSMGEYNGWYRTEEDAQNALDKFNRNEVTQTEEQKSTDGQTRYINGDLYKVITTGQAQKYFDVMVQSEGTFREPMYCSTDGVNGTLTRVYNLAPENWGTKFSDNVFFVPIDLDVDTFKPPKKMYIHESVVDALNIAHHLTYYGSGIYYKLNVKNTFNSDQANLIKLDDDGDVVCRGNKLRLGRVLQQIDKNLDSTEIEMIVSKHKANYVVDTSRVQTSKDVGMVYDISECGGSCMAHKPHSWFEIYEDAGSYMAYIKENGRLKARALVHTVIGIDTGREYTVLDRVFFDLEIDKLTIKKWADEQGFTRMSRLEESVRTKNSINTSYDGVPYIDNLCYATYFDGHLYLTNSSDRSYEDYLQNTDGGSDNGIIACGEDRVWCEDEDRYVHIDDAYYCETDGEYYANDCDLVYIDGSYYHTEDDDRIAHDENTREYAWKDDLKYCESEDIWTSSDNYVLIEDGRNEGSYENEDEAIYCDDICGYVMHDEATYIENEDIWVYGTDGYYEHSNGKWYSEDENEDEEVA